MIPKTVYPETCNRSLESIEALFSTPSPFYWNMEKAYELHGDVLAEQGFNVDKHGSVSGSGIAGLNDGNASSSGTNDDDEDDDDKAAKSGEIRREESNHREIV